MKKINKNLTLLLGGQLVSQFGDKFYNIAITFWVYKMTNSPAVIGIVLCSQMIGSIVTGLFAGGVVDSFNRKHILVITDIIRGLIISLFAVLFYCHVFNLMLVIIVEILLGINTSFFNTAVPAVLPQIVKEEELLKANSKSQLISGNVSIVGPMFAGITTAAFGYGVAFMANAASFFISALFEFFIKVPDVNRESSSAAQTVKNKLVEGYKYIYHSKKIISIIVTVMIVHFFFGSILVVMPIMAKELSQNSGAELLGYFQTALGIGTIIVATWLSYHKITKNEEKWMFIGFTGIGIMFCMISGTSFIGSPFHSLLLLSLVLLSCSITLTWINFRVVLQKNIINAMVGRVFGVVEAICSSSIPLGMLVFGFVLEHAKFYCALMISGVLLLVASFILSRYYFSRLNNNASLSLKS